MYRLTDPAYLTADGRTDGRLWPRTEVVHAVMGKRSRFRPPRRDQDLRALAVILLVLMSSADDPGRWWTHDELREQLAVGDDAPGAAELLVRLGYLSEWTGGDC